MLKIRNFTISRYQFIIQETRKVVTIRKFRIFIQLKCFTKNGKFLAKKKLYAIIKHKSVLSFILIE